LVVTDDLELDAVLGGSLGGLRTGIALVHEGDLDRLAGGLLEGLGQATDLGAVVGGGWGDVQRQQMAQRVDGRVDLAAPLALGSVVARSSPTLGVERSVRLSSTAAVGSGARPASRRSTTRRSCTIASKTSAVSQRRAWA
jgi:hypothetical protein